MRLRMTTQAVAELVRVQKINRILTKPATVKLLTRESLVPHV